MKRLTVDEALERLVVDECDAGNGPESCVHSYRGSIGAHWALPRIREAMEQYGVSEVEVGFHVALGHPIVVVDGTGPVFFEARV